MPLATTQDEAKMKKESLFLDKLEDGDSVILRSHLYWVITHFLQKKQTSVLCGQNKGKEEKCLFCEKGSIPRKEYFYFAEVSHKDGQVDAGILRLPASVFYEMNNVERLVGEDKRTVIWVIGKKGSGKQTKYSTIKGKSVEIDEADVAEKTKKLTDVMGRYEAQLDQRAKELYMQLSDEDIEVPEPSDEDEAPAHSEQEAPPQKGGEEDIPF